MKPTSYSNTKEFLEKAKEAFQGCTVLRTRVGQEDYDDDGNLIKTKPDWGIDGKDGLIDTSLKLIPDSQKQAFTAALNVQHSRALQAKKEAAQKIINWAAGAAAVVAAIPFVEKEVGLDFTKFIQSVMLVKISSSFNLIYLSVTRSDVSSLTIIPDIRTTPISFIQNKNSSENADDYIHLVWLCIARTSARFEDAEINLAKELKNFLLSVSS